MTDVATIDEFARVDAEFNAITEAESNGSYVGTICKSPDELEAVCQVDLISRE